MKCAPTGGASKAFLCGPSYLDGVLTALLRSHTLGRLVRERFELRRKVEARIDDLRRTARRREYQRVLFDGSATTKVRVGDGYAFTYDPDTYPCREVCGRSRDFIRHYYENVGEMGDTGEEFACAQFIDAQPGVKWWVRNLERQPVHSFWLQTSTDKFYPDFVCQLTDGRVLVVEYKGADRATNDDSQEKTRLGELWAARSSGRGLFVMSTSLDFSAITKAICS